MLTPKQHFINRKSVIEKAFGTQTAFAATAGISRVGLFKTLNGITKNKLMQEHICRLLGVTKESFWPELYGDVEIKKSHDETIIQHDQTVN
jgi:lambda repressor-like predicted transcriptional regulator